MEVEPLEDAIERVVDLSGFICRTRMPDVPEVLRNRIRGIDLPQRAVHAQRLRHREEIVGESLQFEHR